MATAPPPGTAASSLPSVGGTSSSTLSEWAGPYVTNMLGQAQALSNQPYQTYQGPMTAGQSGLQTSAFQGIGSLALPTNITNAATSAGNVVSSLKNLEPFSPTKFTNQFSAPDQYTAGPVSGGTFDTAAATQYMNPYIEQVLNPALTEARRQANITRAQDAARMAQSGAFGGGRQAIMESELNRNLMEKQNQMLQQGYASAYDRAAQQYNADQARALQAYQLGEQAKQFGAQQAMTGAQQKAQFGLASQQAEEAAKQFGAQYGLQGLAQQLAAAQAQGQLGATAGAEERANLAQQLSAGQQQRDIEQQGITADYNEFLQQRDYPLKQVQFLQSMLQGLPISTVTNVPSQQSGLGSLASSIGGLGTLVENFNKLAGLFSTTTPPPK